VTSTTAVPRPYHHGDLRNALVDAGVELAREGGPSAIVLREVARRVGVSPNAAYRHFEALPDLIGAVAHRGLAELAAAMVRELDLVPTTADPAQNAWEYLRATGRGYIRFALAEPGLFATAFDPAGKLTVPPPPSPDGVEDNPMDLLLHGLDGLIATGLLDAGDKEAARTLAWSAVHGLSLLLVGPMRGLTDAERDEAIEAMLDQIGKGLVELP
jgi:AcrR family transcriptional regulator